MLALIGTILGLLGSFVPELLKLWKAKEDHKHELAILQVQAEMAKSEHQYRIEEINVQGDISSEQAVYRAAEIKLTGIKIVDALLAFYNGTVRPTVAYAYFALYAIVKYAMYLMLIKESTSTPWYSAVVQLWNSEDMAVFSTVMAFYFGGRFMKYAMDRYGVGTNGNGEKVERHIQPIIVPITIKPEEKPEPGEIFNDPSTDNTRGF